MKKLLTLMMVVMVSLTSFAQKDVIKFLGIPVDGTVAAMKQKLMAKGFRQSPYYENQLEGTFNGAEVYVNLMGNNGKIWRVSVGDKNLTDETNVRIRFNNLVHQFSKNNKYVAVSDVESYIIPDDTNISFEMSVHRKRFEADFFQVPSDSMTVNAALNSLMKTYTIEQFNNPTPEQKKDMDRIIGEATQEVFEKHLVWFMINENYGKYSVMIHYENGYNQANGEDL